MKQFWPGFQKYFLKLICRFLPLSVNLLVARIFSFHHALLPKVFLKIRRKRIMDLSFGRLLYYGYFRALAWKEHWIIRVKTEQLTNIPNWVTLSGTEYFEEARRSGRGVILLSVHSLYFRLLQLWLNQTDLISEPYLIKKFPTQGNEFERVLHHHQQQIFNNRLLNSKTQLKKSVQILKNGGTILLCQDTEVPEAEPIMFLERPFRNPLGGIRMAEISNALIVPVMATHGSGLRPSWQIVFWPVIDPGAAPELAKEQVVRALEKMILTYPETWTEWGNFL